MTTIEEETDLQIIVDLAAIKRRSQRVTRTFGHVAVLSLVGLNVGLLVFGWANGFFA